MRLADGSLDWAGIALAITAVGGVIIGVIQAFKVAKKVTQIDAAVNGKTPGEQPMVSQVQDLHNAIEPPPPPVAILPLVQQIHSRLFPDNGDHEKIGGTD